MDLIAPLTSQFAAPVAFVLRRFTVDEYHRMAKTGVLKEDDRVELLEGVISPKMIHNPHHDVAISLVEQSLRPYLEPGWIIRIQCPIATVDSEPEPDLAVVRGRPRDFSARHPWGAEVALVVEVADSSLLRDRAKARLYARADVSNYWIVNLVDGQIEVHLQPTGPASEPAYQQSVTFRRGDIVPLALNANQLVKVAVDDLLP